MTFPKARPDDLATVGPTQRCLRCAALVRFDPIRSVWRHVALEHGLDHAPEVMADPPERRLHGHPNDPAVRNGPLLPDE